MARTLPDLSRDDFGRRLRAAAPGPLAAEVVDRLFRHYGELSRWNPRLSLIGPGTTTAAVERHYGESLAALPLLPAGPATLVDIGSGAGFPGLVLAAARRDLNVTLVEARARKWSFLLAAVRRCGLSCRCLDARVGPTLPEGFPERVDVVTMRALEPSEDLLATLRPRLAPGAVLLLWVGRAMPHLPPWWSAAESRPIGGSAHRRIVAYRSTSEELRAPERT